MTARQAKATASKSRRRWSQFSVRTLLVLTLVVSLFFSWLAVETRRAQRQRAAVNALQAMGRYDYEFDDSFEDILQPRHPAPHWLRQLTHKDLLTHVVTLETNWGQTITAEALAELEHLPRLRSVRCENCVIAAEGLAHLSQLTELRELSLQGSSGICDDGMKYLRPLIGLKRLTLSGTEITDDGMKCLRPLTGLKDLRLSGTEITDRGLIHIQGMTELTDLAVINTQITDAGLEHLRHLKKLERLFLGGTRVTDHGLACLEGLTNLWKLDVRNTKVSPQRLRQFKQVLPNCRFVVSPGQVPSN